MKKPFYTLFFLLSLLPISILCFCGVLVIENSDFFATLIQKNAFETGDNVAYAQEESFSLADAQTQSNAFRIIRTVDEKITLTYVFPVNSAVLEQLDASEQAIQTYKFHLTIFVAALASQNRTKAGSGVSVGNVTYYTDVDGLGFSIVFDDLSAQRQFFASEDEDGDSQSSSSSTSATSKTTTSGLFIQKTSLSTSFPISTTEGADSLKKVCTLAIDSWAASEEVSFAMQSALVTALENSLYIYDFASTNTHLQSQLMADGTYHHNYFVRTYQTLSDDIVFFVTSINAPIWYASALIFTILGMLIAYFVLQRRLR